MLSPDEAARVLLERRKIRRSLAAWSTRALAPLGFQPAAHHRLLIEKLEDVAQGRSRRLIFCLPPGSAKSTYASDLFPAWWLAQGPNRSVIGASNTATLAESFSRRVRGRIREHGALLGLSLVDEAVDLWTTSNGSQYRAAGVGGTITGLRASMAIIDDPVKSREDAESEVRRNRVWEWFQDDLTTRLKPGAPVIVIGTRWHEDDLIGRLLERQAGEWDLVSLPAQCESPDDPLGREVGEWLWGDDGYGYAEDMKAKAALADPRTWSALYQQRPAPESGDFFKAEWLRPVAQMPARETLRIYGASDYAVTDRGGDWTVHVVVGLDASGRMWLLDLWRGQASSDLWVEAFCDLVEQWKPIGWAEETGQIRAGVGPFLTRRMRERGAFVHREQFPTRGDKGIRAQSIRGRMALEGLYLPQQAPWRSALTAELMSFPAGKHDDQVDALGLVGQLLDKMTTGPKPKAPAKPVDRWERAFSRSGGRVDAARVA